MLKQFNQTITQLRFGSLNTELTEKLAELTQKCVSTGRNGELTLVLKLKPGKAGQMEILDEIKIKNPKEERGSSLFFCTPEGNLQREDPRQMTFEGLKTIETNPIKLKEVN